jgi:hypothetical protein
MIELGNEFRAVELFRPPELRLSSEQMVGLVIVACIGLLLFSAPPRRVGCYAESRVDIAMLTVAKFANEAYPQWARDNPEARCPSSLDPLLDYMDQKHTRDPWGRSYELDCRAGMFGNPMVVTSRGADGVRGTDDDIRSDR